MGGVLRLMRNAYREPRRPNEGEKLLCPRGILIRLQGLAPLRVDLVGLGSDIGCPEDLARIDQVRIADLILVGLIEGGELVA